jgi:hypothetical protein
VLYIPWLPYLRGKALAVIGKLEPLTAHNVVIDAARTIVGYPYAPLRAIPTYLGIGIVLACGVAGFCALARFARTRGPLLDRRSWPRHFWVLVALALANPLLLLLYSMASTDLWLARNLYASMPAQALVLATLVVVPYRRLAWVLGVAVAAVLAVGLVRSISPTWQRTPYYSIARYLDRHASTRQPIQIDSFFGDILLPILFDRPQSVVSSAQFARAARGADQAFVVTDRYVVYGVPVEPLPKTPPDMTIARRIRYHNAIMPGTEIVIYRRASGRR